MTGHRSDSVLLAWAALRSNNPARFRFGRLTTAERIRLNYEMDEEAKLAESTKAALSYWVEE